MLMSMMSAPLSAARRAPSAIHRASRPASCTTCAPAPGPLGAQARLAGAGDQPLARDHLGDHHAGAECRRDRAERPVRHPRHGRQEHAVGQGDRADGKRLSEFGDRTGSCIPIRQFTTCLYISQNGAAGKPNRLAIAAGVIELPRESPSTVEATRAMPTSSDTAALIVAAGRGTRARRRRHSRNNTSRLAESPCCAVPSTPWLPTACRRPYSRRHRRRPTWRFTRRLPRATASSGRRSLAARPGQDSVRLGLDALADQRTGACPHPRCLPVRSSRPT